VLVALLGRMTMYDALQHPMFASLRVSADVAARVGANGSSSSSCCAGYGQETNVVSYMHYYRAPVAGSLYDGLPIL
jgi:hypothetical protein